MTETNALELVATWYKKVDEHAAVEEITALVDFSSFQIKNDAICVDSPESFGKWYSQLIGMFFDECHTIVESKTYWEGDTISVWVRVNAKGRMWQAPAPKSTLMEFDTAQVFMIREVNGQPALTGFEVEYMKQVDTAAL